PGPESARQIKIEYPILTNEELDKLRQIKAVSGGRFKSVTLPIVYRAKEGAGGLERALASLCKSVDKAISAGSEYIILSDRPVDLVSEPTPALLAMGAVPHHLIRHGTRTKVSLVIETGEPREVHHFALLIGYGAGAVNPYLAFETLDDMLRQGE